MSEPTIQTLHVLHLEDDRDYTHLVKALLESDGLNPTIRVASTGKEFETALDSEEFDIILADYQLPGYNGLLALQYALTRRPETPFLLVSGTIGEQAAIESLRAGATDYVLKVWPERLVPAIRRAVQESRERDSRRKAECELVRHEKYFQALTENSLDVITTLDTTGTVMYCSPSIKRVLGYEPGQFIGGSAFEVCHPEDLGRVREFFEKVLTDSEGLGTTEFRARHADGSWRDIEAVAQSRLNDPEIQAVVVHSRDVTDRKLAQSSQRESESHYQIIFNENPIPMWVFDHETLGFLEVNEAAIQHYGYSREEFLRMRMKDLDCSSGDDPALIEYLHKLTNLVPEGTLAWTGSWQHRTKSGSHIDVEMKWTPLNWKGRPASLTMANDVSERKRAEHRSAALSQLGQSLSSATSAQDAAGIIKDVTDDLFRWDVFTLNLCSQDQEQLVPILNVDTDEKGERFAISSLGRAIPVTPLAKRVIAHGAEMILRDEPFTFTDGATPIGDVKRASGSLIFVPIRHGRRVIGMLSIQSYAAHAYDHRDLDMLQTLADACGGALERIRAEHALHGSELMFHSVWENAVEGMRLTDAGGCVIAVNEAYCRIMGITREELEGKPFTAVYPPTHEAEGWLEEYRKKFTAREVIEGAQWTCKLQNGSMVTLEETGCFVELRGQSPLLLTVFRDVSEQKRLEEQLRHSQKMEAIGQLAGGVAHDFNNILTVIHGHASLLERSPALAESCLRSARQIGQAAERAASLTRQLLTFGRRQVMQPRTLDMNEVVGNFTRMLGRILGEDIAVQLKYSPEPALVRADACMMEQVLMNLAVNSRDAMPKGGLLTIKVSARETTESLGAFKGNPGRAQVWLEVTDTGCGIPAAHLSRVFEPFFTTKEVGKGTGLGLATVYGIVQQHQGRVEATSQVGVGTTFRILLPRCEDAEPQQKSTPAEDQVKGGHETILVVEDEGEVRELVCSLLAQCGYKILQAESGAKALELWQHKREKIHLLLTDLIMPDRVNGRELAERLLAHDPGLKVLFTSGYSADVVGRDFAINRAFRFLQKPYQPQKLAAVVRQCLDAVN